MTASIRSLFSQWIPSSALDSDGVALISGTQYLIHRQTHVLTLRLSRFLGQQVLSFLIVKEDQIEQSTAEVYLRSELLEDNLRNRLGI